MLVIMLNKLTDAKIDRCTVITDVLLGIVDS